MRLAVAAGALALVATACSGSSSPSTSAPGTSAGVTTSTGVGETTSTIPPTTTVTTTTVAATTTTPPPQHRIGVRVVDGRGEFYDHLTDERFVVRGANYIFVRDAVGNWVSEPLDTGHYDRALLRSDFATLAGAGFTTVRMFIDPCGSPPGCITRPGFDGLDPVYLDNLADALDAAAETGLFLLLTSNDIPDDGGYGALANSEASDTFAGYRNAHYLTASGHAAAVAYWDDLMAGLVSRNARFDHVLGWSLLNEQWLFALEPPLSLTAGAVTTADGATYDMADPAQKQAMVASNLRRYAGAVRDTIVANDPTALVTMGFFAPQFPNATGIGGDWFVDTVGLVDGGAPFDFYDFHAYPGEDISLAQIAENFGMPTLDEIPVVMGEYGAFNHRFPDLRTAARAVTNWQAESCDLGFDGWLYWSYRADPGVGDASWDLLAEDGFLLDLLSPVAHPDPCVAAAVPTSNLAFGAAVTASSQLAGEEAALVVDEDPTTQWGAGAFPVQWLEVDLGAEHTVTAIRLLVAQFPEGTTIHRVLVGAAPGALSEVHRFEGTTAADDLLEFLPDEPLTGVRIVRIETTSSPSWVAWREVEVLGD